MIMRALGAEVTRTPDAEGMQGAIQRANDLAATTFRISLPRSSKIPPIPITTTRPPGTKFSSRWTAGSMPSRFGCGTAGTFSGVARYLKERMPRSTAVAVETQGSVLGGGKAGPHKVEGIGISFIPRNFDRSVCDEVFMVDRPARVRHGEGAGRSRRRAGRIKCRAPMSTRRWRSPSDWAGKRVVTMIPDSAERYLSKNIFEGGSKED